MNTCRNFQVCDCFLFQMLPGVGAISNSISSLDLGGINEDSAQTNGDIFGQLGSQDHFLAASTGGQ